MTLPVTPRQIRAARALLDWSQQDLAREARVALSTVADFERAARQPITNNLAAMRNALERAGLLFERGGVVFRDREPR